MNPSVEYQSHKVPALKESEKKPAYMLGAAFLLALWAAFSAATVLLVVAVFVPGHLGLSDWLRVLGDSPMVST
jgi:hypothetical protein